jgi:hypothetical protein
VLTRTVQELCTRGGVAQDGYFCPSPRKVPNADLRPELLTDMLLFKVSAPERRRTEDRVAFFYRSDRRNVKSDRAAAHGEAINAY